MLFFDFRDSFSPRTLQQKPRRVSLPQQRNKPDHFLPRRVRGKKYFSAGKRGNRPQFADDFCAAACCKPFVKKALLF